MCTLYVCVCGSYGGQVNDRDTAKLDELTAARDEKPGDGHGEAGGDRSLLAGEVEVANVTVGSMVRMATVDK